MANIEEFVNAMMGYNVIDPVITYDGDYTYQSIKKSLYNPKADILMLNSKVDKDGKNMYEELMHDYYYKCVNMNNVGNVPQGYIFPLLVNQMSEDGKHRVLRYNYIFTVMNLTENKEDLHGTTDISVLAERARDWYKEQRRVLKEFKKDRNNPEVKDMVLLRFVATPDFQKRFGMVDPRFIKENPDYVLDAIPDSWLDFYCDKFTSIIITLRHIINHSNEKHNVPISAFEACFEPETFLLMNMKVIIDNQGSSIKLNGKPDNCLVEVAQYLSTLDQLGIKNYNYSIKYYDSSSKEVKKYTVKDLRNDFNRLMNRFQGTISNYQLTSDQIDKMGLSHSVEAMDKFRELIKQDEEDIIKADWDILSPGEKEIDYTPRASRKSSDSESNKKRIDEDEILYRKYIFQQTDYLKQIVGREKFQGYVGYIYENGLVIFEKFYEDGGKVAQMQATYVMNYKNFIQFTQLTKPEILEYIKNTDNPDIKRLYHTKNWANNLASIIGSVDKTMESQVFAETLSSGDVKVRKRSDN